LPSVSDEKSSIIPPAPPVTLAPPIVPIIPIKIYSNAEADKAQILSDNQNKSGIYMWKNSINNQCYIGSSENLNRRFREYFNDNHLRVRNYMAIHRAILKHGHSLFLWQFLSTVKQSNVLKGKIFIYLL